MSERVALIALKSLIIWLVIDKQVHRQMAPDCKQLRPVVSGVSTPAHPVR